MWIVPLAFVDRLERSDRVVFIIGWLNVLSGYSRTHLCKIVSSRERNKKIICNVQGFLKDFKNYD
jgi:hypothetical protein